jgi:ribosomal protein S18 acetylase RimI-like enzyme
MIAVEREAKNMQNGSDHSGEQIILRPIAPQDDSFLFQVYASTRSDEMALVKWSEEQIADFLWMQFSAQRKHYLHYFPGAEYSLICLEDHQPVGRIIIDRSGDEILLMDIALLPGFRNAGIGTRLVLDLQDEAQAKGLPVHLHVEAFNRALHLYERLGFTIIGEDGIYLKMEWLPSDGERTQTQTAEKEKIYARETL